uniref:Uncharacterized protein n=1 Tax=Branchiostoma floridae TaxID=7739 RepID=C3ZX56_BRAFL|eukprot:XP_002586874.1 hypothetical protein BRAFLDRAFT_101771 [Branchiostoma floridae]
MEKRTGQCVVIVVLFVLKYCSPCPEECFVHFVQDDWRLKSCMCPTQRDSSFLTSCMLPGVTDLERQNPAHKRPSGTTINTSDLQSALQILWFFNNANKDTETTEETEENSQLTPYLTVHFDAINNTLHVEPNSSVNLEDIRNDETDVNLRRPCGNREMWKQAKDEVQDGDGVEPYCSTPLD